MGNLLRLPVRRSLLLLIYGDMPLIAIAAELGHVHGAAQNRKRMEAARNFSKALITKLPDTLGQLIQERDDFAVALLLVNPLRAACVILIG